jgi:hypothetical protein
MWSGHLVKSFVYTPHANDTGTITWWIARWAGPSQLYGCLQPGVVGCRGRNPSGRGLWQLFAARVVGCRGRNPSGRRGPPHTVPSAGPFRPPPLPLAPSPPPRRWDARPPPRLKRDIHTATAVARRFYWSEYNMWPDMVRGGRLTSV